MTLIKRFEKIVEHLQEDKEHLRNFYDDIINASKGGFDRSKVLETIQAYEVRLIYHHNHHGYRRNRKVTEKS
jgi:hypothetical protein